MNTNTKFFNFAAPFFNSIDNGSLFKKPFLWLYTLIAIINLLIPVFVFSRMKDYDMFDYYLVESILTLIILTFSSWISFQLWWNRRSNLISSSSEGDDFIATPIFAHFIQTLGESIGINIAVGGFGMALVFQIILGETSDIEYLFGVPGYILLFGPIFGFLTIVAFRFIAEQFRALSSIANNTKK